MITMIKPIRLYLGGKMVGEPEFGFRPFDDAAAALRALPYVKLVFNPAENDRKNGFDTSGFSGTDEEMDAAGFSRRKALQQDFSWISRFSEGMIVLPNWKLSEGAFAEIVFHQANHLPVWRFDEFLESGGDESELAALVIPNMRELASQFVAPL